MSRRMWAAAVALALVAALVPAVATAAPGDPCEASYRAPMNSTEKLRAYLDCRLDRLDKGLAPAPTVTVTTTATPASPSVTPSSSVTPSPSSSVPAVLDLPREAWSGGAGYWAKFPKAVSAGWTDPNFFPIAVFLGKPEHATALKAAGINTYMGAEHDGSTMASITNTGMSVIAQSEWTPAEVGNDQRVVGWHLSDECDMGYSGCGDDEATQLATQTRYATTARARNDGRFLQANFGNGVLGTWWAKTTMPQHLGLVDVSSVDKYAYTSPHVQGLLPNSPFWPAGKTAKSAGAYGWLQDRMESFTSPAGTKPNWVFVESAMPYLTEAGATSITPEQAEGAVWNSIIHGASGIAWFQHNNGPGCGTYSIVDCPAQRAAVTKVNSQVQSLAKVLNTQPYVWGFGAGLDTSLRVSDGYAYIIAMTDGGSGSRTFTLPAGITGSTVEVVGESRTLPISGGKFTDTFAAESVHHVYRIRL